MIERLRLLFRHFAYNLRGGFLVRPVTIAIVLGCAGAVLSWAEESNPSIGNWVPPVLFLSHADPEVAQVILSSIAESIMTVVSIVFAILLMTLTLASMQFSPRIIVSFARDRITQWTLGIFLGTFLYCMAALPAAHALPHPFAPVVTVIGAIWLSIACVALLLFFIHHISQAISVSHIVDRIASETEVVIDEIMPFPRKTVHLETSDSTTAIGCIDQLSRILICFASREAPESRLYDLRGAARVHIQWIDFKRILDSAFDQIRMYSKGDIAVSLRLLRAIGDIAITIDDSLVRKALIERAKRIVDGCAESIGAEELRPLLIRLADISRAVAA
ncbi:MAG TPA: DUF2254 family protein [Candidatus Acidoferrales bacterium]|nr:DUF2254 family protein [Candidatus Acidoferrales bacterium]